MRRAAEWIVEAALIVSMTVLIALVLGGCSIPATVPAFQPAPVAEAPVSRQVPATWTADDYCAWADDRFSEWSRRFKIPVPAVIFLNESIPIVRIIKMGPFPIAIEYKLAHYDIPTRTVCVWLLDESGKPMPPDQIQHSVMHEAVHWWDAEHAIAAPDGDHNALFDKRIEAMGLDR